MSFQEFNNAIEGTKSNQSTLPPIGGYEKTPKNTKVKIRYFLANIEDPSMRAMLEDIMTKSINGQGLFTEIGDVIVLREDSHFTKDGDYMAAIKYVELVANDEVTPVLAKNIADRKKPVPVPTEEVIPTVTSVNDEALVNVSTTLNEDVDGNVADDVELDELDELDDVDVTQSILPHTF